MRRYTIRLRGRVALLNDDGRAELADGQPQLEVHMRTNHPMSGSGPVTDRSMSRSDPGAVIAVQPNLVTQSKIIHASQEAFQICADSACWPWPPSSSTPS